VGVSILAVLVVACLPWTLNIIHDPIAYVTLALIGFGTLAGALALLALGISLPWGMGRWWITRHLLVVSRLGWRLCQSVTGARVTVYSFAIHFMTVIVAWGAAKAAHATLDLIHALFLILPVILIATLPVSIAGWGVRESTMIVAFSYAGLPEIDGLIVSILFGIANLSVGAIGGIAWVADGYRWRSIKSSEIEIADASSF
jgi:hypothetical protein